MIFLSGFLILFIFSAIQHIFSKYVGYILVIPVIYTVFMYVYYINYKGLDISNPKILILTIFGVLLIIGEGYRTKKVEKQNTISEMDKIKKKNI